jgi:hypothetical protein
MFGRVLIAVVDLNRKRQTRVPPHGAGMVLVRWLARLGDIVANNSALLFSIQTFHPGVDVQFPGTSGHSRGGAKVELSIEPRNAGLFVRGQHGASQHLRLQPSPSPEVQDLTNRTGWN